MSNLLANYFAAAENRHPRQTKTAATNPELAQARADVDALITKTEKLASVVDQIFAAGDKAAAAAPSIVEKFFADKGVKMRAVATGEKRFISPQQRNLCRAIFGESDVCDQEEVGDYE